MSGRMTALRMGLPVLLMLALLVPLASPGRAQGPCDLGAPAQTEEPLVLCGTTTIRGSESASALVRLPSDATLSADFWSDDPDVRIQGEGAFVGFALHRGAEAEVGVLAGKLPKKHPYLVDPDWQFGRDPTDPYVMIDVSWTVLSPAEAIFLPAGDYLLDLFADGSPAEVTIRLSGLEGATTLSPATPTSATARKLTPQVPAGHNKYLATGTAELTGPGIVLLDVWVTWERVQGASPEVANWIGSCLYRGAPPVHETLLEWPCPSTVDDGWVLNVGGRATSPEAKGRERIDVWSLKPGQYGVKAWSTTLAPAYDAGAVAVWLPW